MNKANKETMANVEAAQQLQAEREESAKKKKVIGTAKPEWLLQQLDVKKKTLDLPDMLEHEGKTYKVRKETITGLISLSKLFFPTHTKSLEKTLETYDAKVGRPRPSWGETRKYQISNKGMLAVPIKFIMNKDLEGTGAALVTFYEDRIEVRNEMPSKK